ncbi:TPA: hypothetical protein SMI10_004246 [Serratia liquefaciens]|nr:hypothetical protein [Serratia liquefaciens]HEJ7947977.1 hypothetical protein [Serratia liquefaciens]HEJ7994491.1 hypothetical protein [Serratia liquefaciens]
MILITERLREITEDGFIEHGDAKAIARELQANREAQPVGFDALADAVKEVTGGIRMEFAADTYKGHQPVPFMNFTSLSRIVEMFRTTPPAPAVDIAPDFEAWFNSPEAGLRVVNFHIQHELQLKAWNACCTAMLDGTFIGEGTKSQPASQGYKLNSPDIPDGCQWTYDEHDYK